MARFIGDARLGAVDAAGSAALPCARTAGVSESAAISSAIVSAVGEADRAAAAAAAVARGTSTKSPVSDRGDWRGGEVERRAEEDRDQTISSSSESESLAHVVVLELSESTSSEEESEAVVMIVWKGARGAGEMEKK